MLDFTAYQKPTFTVKLRGGDTALRLIPPSVELVDELQKVGELLPDAGTGDQNALGAVYAIAAALMSCNRDGITVWPEDMTGKYDLDLEDMAVFFAGYVEFIDGLSERKN